LRLSLRCSATFRIKPLIRVMGKRRHRPVAPRAVLACKSEARSETPGRGFCAVDRGGLRRDRTHFAGYPRVIRGGSDDAPSPAQVTAEAEIIADG
jgi:hypothetical protein